MKTSAMMLADFQENVGSKPLTILGVDDSVLSEVGKRDMDYLQKLAGRIANNPDRKLYESFSKLVDQDTQNIQNKILAAEVLKKKIPSILA